MEDGGKDESDGSELSPPQQGDARGAAQKRGDDGLGPEARAQRAAAPYINAVWRVVGGVLVGGGTGWFVDGKLHSSPWGLIVGLFVGMGAGFYGLIQGLNAMKKR